MKKNIISFSVYGADPKYVNGAVKNAELCHAIYPGWICRFYYNDTVPSDIISKLKNTGAEVVDMSASELKNFGMYWRFLVYDDAEVERFIVRDTDSRLNTRERAAVDAWIKSGKHLHIMRDHPYHNVKILGGTWGMWNDHRFNMKERILNFIKQTPEFKYSDDQTFLNSIYEIYKDDMISYDDFFNYPSSVKFPVKRKGLEFVGQVFDENEETIELHQQLLKEELERRNISILKKAKIRIAKLIGR